MNNKCSHTLTFRLLMNSIRFFPIRDRLEYFNLHIRIKIHLIRGTGDIKHFGKNFRMETFYSLLFTEGYYSE